MILAEGRRAVAVQPQHRGETNQWAPLIYDGTTKVEPPGDPDYHFATSMTEPVLAEWWLRPVKIAMRVGEQSAVV